MLPSLSDCDKCVRTKCCAEITACSNVIECSDTSGEWQCINKCVDTAAQDGGIVDKQTITDCVGNCAQGCGGFVTDATNNLIACINAAPTGDAGADSGAATNCAFECFGAI